MDAINDRTDGDAKRAAGAVVRDAGDVSLGIESNRLVAAVVARHVACERESAISVPSHSLTLTSDHSHLPQLMHMSCSRVEKIVNKRRPTRRTHRLDRSNHLLSSV